jgi:hypothetical protein
LVCLDDLASQQEADEGSRHWIQIYARRPYARWVAKMGLINERGQVADHMTVLGRGQLDAVPRRTPILLAGRFTESSNRLSGQPIRLLEACVAIPLHRPTPDAAWQPDRERIVVFPPTPEALATLPAVAPPPLQR